MYKNERQKEIQQILLKEGYVTVEYLSQKIHISPSSIRRDLQDLEKKGQVQRSYGGVELLNTPNRFVPFTMRSHKNASVKKSIAQRAASLIQMGNVIFLDASSSAYFMAEPLSSLKDITVITNSIDTLYLLSQYNIKTYSTGGLISSENRSCLAGPSAVRTVREFQADFLFFSAQAISSNGIISDCYEQEVFLRQAMMQNAGQTVFLCDESKLGQRSIFKLCDISNVDTIICNTALDGYFERTYPSLNILQT